jgi:LPXTG-motif cell wall-anchored protein
VTFGNQPEFNGHTATITFIDVNGVVVATHTATYQANTSVRFIYPGASVDAAGNATDWPGWRFDGDEWVLDPTDAYLRDGMTVRVEVNPVATGQVAYPPPDSGCANPVNPPGGGGTPALPVTGGAAGPTAAVAAGAIALGGLAFVLARRRPGRAA